MKSVRLLTVTLLAVLALADRAAAQKVLELRTQEVNGTTYFHVRLKSPADLAGDVRRDERLFDRFGFDQQMPDPLLRPRLVPQGEGAKAVYSRLSMNELERQFGGRFGPGVEKIDEKEPPPEKKVEDKKPVDKDECGEKKPVEKDFGEKGFDDKGFDKKDDAGMRGAPPAELEFFGKVEGKKQVAFLLVYPKEDVKKKGFRDKLKKIFKGGKNPPKENEPKEAKGKEPEKGKSLLMQALEQRQPWAEVKVTLDFAKATKVPMPDAGFQRKQQQPPGPRDLEGQWAVTQAVHFALLEAETPDFGFYGLARESTGRKYNVPTPMAPWMPRNFRDFEGPGGPGGRGGNMHLYEITTGAAAITESLALQRMRDRRFGGEKQEQRTLPIGKVRGIDIGEHPWEKMMGDKKPADEPLAKLVPHDNYYLHFKNIAKFLEAGDLIEEWGTTLVRTYEVQTKDYRLKQRIEQQLCLKSTGIARIFGPAVIKGVVVTGSDPYIREGSDISILFHLSNKDLFLTSVNAFIDEARKKFGKQLKEDKADHQGIAIESYVTPLREVSLHRAFVGDVAVYGNSKAGVQRIIDASKGKLTPLADSLDFQYMRTVFRADDKGEDGFVFLSDPFIRKLVGPATRIKERRRLEALTSLQMVTQGAMFTAWETGRLPLNHQHILQATGIKQEELFTPDGGGAFWDAEKKLAVSGVYNTLHFATPLIELPIDRVTQTESREYEDFRRQYLGLWRQYFDPIGMRLSLKKDEVKWDTYILPLVRSTQYDELRRMAGGAGIKLDPKFFSEKTLAQFLLHLSPELLEEPFAMIGGFGGGGLEDIAIDVALRSWMGEWATIRLDDSPVYTKLLENAIRRELQPNRRHDFVDDIELALQIPLTVGVEIRNPAAFAGIVASLRKGVESSLPGAVDWRPMEPYKGVSIVRVKSRPRDNGPRLVEGPNSNREPNFALYYALIDGAFYLSLREEPIKDLIDRSAAMKEKGEKGSPKVESNASLYLAPGAMNESKGLVTLYLEWTAHHRALSNNRLLYAMYRSNVVSPGDTGEQVEAAALQFLGYVPISPDGAPFGYDAAHDEVANKRHGTLRQPKLHTSIEPDSPTGRLLAQLQSIRADLRFREDGIHTTLSMRRK